MGKNNSNSNELSDEEKTEFYEKFGEESDRRTKLTILGALIIIGYIGFKIYAIYFG